jgi:uncharacterized protein YdcH (DUF465 family)
MLEVENTMTDSERRRGDNYPKYIYYCATEEEAARFRSKFSAFNEESLTFEGRYLLDKSNETASKMDTVNRTVDTIQDTMDKMRKENAELRDMVKMVLQHTGVHLPTSFSTESMRSRSESHATTISPLSSARRRSTMDQRQGSSSSTILER